MALVVGTPKASTTSIRSVQHYASSFSRAAQLTVCASICKPLLRSAARKCGTAHLGDCTLGSTCDPRQHLSRASAYRSTHSSYAKPLIHQHSWKCGSSQVLRRSSHRTRRGRCHGLVSAVVSRLLGASPRIIARTILRILTRLIRPLTSGPASVIVLVVTLIGAVYAAVRTRMAASTRSCGACRGFGIRRCNLCRGAGAVGWEGKWNHQEICPSCLGKRFVNCSSCGGHFHRPTFAHSRNKTRSEILASVDGGEMDADSNFLQRLTGD